MIVDHLRYWRCCADARCRRARACQDYQCYWRRLRKLPVDEMLRVRESVKPFAQLLWIGSDKGSEGRPLYDFAGPHGARA
jgi:hypothetical protein